MPEHQPVLHQLLGKLLSRCDDLSNPFPISQSELERFPQEQILALKQRKWLVKASYARQVRCPEEACRNCVLPVERYGSMLYLQCPEPDISIVRIDTRLTEQWKINFENIADALTKELEAFRLHESASDILPVCLYQGHSIFFSAGIPVLFGLGEHTVALSDLFLWNGQNYIFQMKPVTDLLQQAGNKKESKTEHGYRLYCRFLELKPKLKTSKATWEKMAQEEGCSVGNIRRLLDDARHDPEVCEKLGIAHKPKKSSKNNY